MSARTWLKPFTLLPMSLLDLPVRFLPNCFPKGNLLVRQRKENLTPKFLTLETEWVVMSFVKDKQAGVVGGVEES